MMDKETLQKLIDWEARFNDRAYFAEDPIIFPRKFAEQLCDSEACDCAEIADMTDGKRNGDKENSGRENSGGRKSGYCLADVEIAAIFASHLAWGRRSMIVRDCERLFDHMQWRPFDYIMAGDYRNDPTSLHRTIKWSEIAQICQRLKGIYESCESIEGMSNEQIRTLIYGRKADPKAPDKKINMMRRWMTRRDGKVDLGVWRNSEPKDLLIPLDVHVYTQARELGLTSRSQKDILTVQQITDQFKQIWPDDPCRGDFALFGYGVTSGK